MFTNDYILRQIELMAKGVAKVFKKQARQEGDIVETRSAGSADSLIQQLYDLVDENKLCEAEDTLFAYAEANPTTEVFGIAVEFYNMLDNLSDNQLVAADFPRGDIAKGLSALLKVING